MIPCMALFAGAFLDEAAGRLPVGRPWRNGILSAGCMLLAIAPIRSNISRYRGMARKDVRIEAMEWIDANIPAGSRIYVEEGGPPISRQKYEVYYAKGGKLIRDDWHVGWKYSLHCCEGIDTLMENGIEYAILTFWYDRFLAERDRNVGPLEIYESFFRKAALIKSFGGPNHPISVYRMPPPRGEVDTPYVSPPALR